MKTYEELVKEYRKRQQDTVVDTIAAGLTYMDEMAVDTGLLEETGLLTDTMESLTGILPFAIITVSEGSKILLKKKPGKTGLKDGAFRMVKTGAALGVGAAVAGAAGFWAAIPVTMGVRALFDKYRSRALTGHRVQSRIQRLRELNRFIRNEEPERSEELPVREKSALAAEGTVE
jgi:ClpP class serine protease